MLVVIRVYGGIIESVIVQARVGIEVGRDDGHLGVVSGFS